MAAAAGMSTLVVSKRERRYAIVAQMRDYDTLEEKEWLPYVMLFQHGGLATSSFSTDEYGFRRTIRLGRQLSWTDYNTTARPRAALIGASTAFGVGASSDAFTVASLLNRRGDRVWFNFAGRSFNSTQELLIFLLHLPLDVDTVLIFSGINNLVLACVSPTTSPIYNSFFAQSVFERGLRSGAVSGVRGSLRLLFHEIAGKLVFTDGGKKCANDRLKYDHVIACFRRDMRLWALLRQALGFKLYFVFQPIASWIDKGLTLEEQEVFEILDSSDIDGTWNELSTYLPEQREQYLADVRAACEELEVPFLDLNSRPSFAENRWLFVDRAHLTDEGYTLAAEEILREFLL